MLEDIISRYSFADSELDGYQRTNDAVTVRIRAWNAQILVIRFSNVIDIHDSLASNFSEVLINAPHRMIVLKKALRRNFVKIPAVHSYRVFTFFDNDDTASLEVVAAEYTVTLEAGESPVSSLDTGAADS